MQIIKEYVCVRDITYIKVRVQIIMSKYDPLWEYIKTKSPAELTFDKVREICGFPIDHAFLNRKKELEAYGYRVGKISMKNRTVQFYPWKQG